MVTGFGQIKFCWLDAHLITLQIVSKKVSKLEEPEKHNRTGTAANASYNMGSNEANLIISQAQVNEVLKPTSYKNKQNSPPSTKKYGK
ncbi:hypothetical protein RJ640_025592 [Escallonia rubra]|uniref:Uncharacterized protein n=1 Tax=Escallonia rubra TaxID=112253 RepID=A0AA88QK76_9ASTE|nr:hypothetical protein RJ640_025592 [Escallonia rubra]